MALTNGTRCTYGGLAGSVPRANGAKTLFATTATNNESACTYDGLEGVCRLRRR